MVLLFRMCNEISKTTNSVRVQSRLSFRERKKSQVGRQFGIKPANKKANFTPRILNHIRVYTIHNEWLCRDLAQNAIYELVRRGSNGSRQRWFIPVIAFNWLIGFAIMT